MAETEDDFADMFRREYRSIVRAVLPIVGELADAEAVAQDAFEKALSRWERVRDYDRPGAWIRRIAIRDAVRSARRRSKHDPLGMDPIVHPEPLTDRLDLDRALLSLPINQRAAVALHHLLGWPTAEIADALGCAESTVRVHLHRGRRALVDLLHDQNDSVPVSEADR